MDDRCYSYPVFYSLMKNRRKTDYMTVFEDLKYYYNHFTKNNLEDILTKIKLDCELACLGALDALFPKCTILLCRVHIIRNWAKWFKHYVCQTFFKNKYYASIFRFFLGITFMDLRDTDILDAIFEHLNYVYESPEMRSKAAGFRSFVQYLLKNYLLPDSKFPFHQWNYHDSIHSGDMGITTNPLENINLKLQSKMGDG